LSVLGVRRRAWPDKTGTDNATRARAQKKPQLPEDHPLLVAGAAQHRVHRVAKRAFLPIPVELSICLHVANTGSIARPHLIIARNPRIDHHRPW
jgi:hypothetical protein